MPRQRSERRHFECLEARDLLAAEPWITELMASNGGTLQDANGDSPDWIELFNAGDQTADLSGWSLTDDPARLQKWTFPPVPLAAGAYLIVFASGQQYPDKVDANGNLHATFRLSAGGEYLALVDPAGHIRQQFSPGFPAQQSDTSYGYPSGSRESSLVQAGTAAQIFVPTTAGPAATWSQPDFVVDAAWQTTGATGQPAGLPVGYDTGEIDAALSAHWSLDAAAGQQVPDTIGRHAGTLFGNTAFVAAGGTPQTGGSLELASAGGVHVPYDTALNPDSFTFSAWVRATSTSGFGAVVTNRYDSGNGNLRGFILYNDNSGHWAFWTGNGSAWETLIGPPVEVDRWTHLAISYDAPTQTKTLFVDGLPAAQTTGHGYLPNRQRDLQLGAGEDFGTNYYFRGNIDDAALFDRALTAAEIARIMQSSAVNGASGRYRGLLQTELSQMPEHSSSAYLRIPFEVTDPARIDQLWFDLRYDDGAVGYLNGTEIMRVNAAGDPPAYDATATAAHEDSGDFTRWDVSSAILLLRSGENVLAIQGLNTSSADEDFLVWPQLTAVEHYVAADQLGYILPATPGAGQDVSFSQLTTATVQFSQPDQTFTGSLQVSLTSDLAAAPIYFTLDGSEPTTASSRYTRALTLQGTTQVRARVILPDAVPGPLVTRSYVRLASDIAQRTSPLPIAVIDNFGRGAVPNSGWNQTNAGIHQLPRQPANLMIFAPTQPLGALSSPPQLSTRVGIRVRGAYSSSFAEPGYSLEIWNEAGDRDTARSVLGMEAASDWVLYAPNPQFDETLMDNTFMFQLQQQMGHWSPDFQYVEMYLNQDGGDVSADDYVGLYVVVEKPERGTGRIDIERFAADGSQGGWILEINRMDSIGEDGQLPKNFHTAGPNGVLQTARDLSDSSSVGDDIPRQYNAYINFEDPNAREVTEPQRVAIEDWFQHMEDVLYDRVPGIAWNDPEQGYAKYIDVDSFIDYLILNNLSHNGDGLLLSMWLYNPDPAGDGKLTFGPIWDVDLGSFSGSPTAELMRNADRLWYGRLFRDKDFAQRYIDRWAELRSDVLSDSNMHALIEGIFAAVGTAAAERDGVGDWPRRLEAMKSWLSTRAEAIDNSSRDRPDFDPPAGRVPVGTSVQIASDDGTVYFTTDGSDPRLPGGEVSPRARVADSQQPLLIDADTQVIARTFRSNRWSAPVNALYQTSPNDINGDGQLTSADLDAFCQGLMQGDPLSDRNQDGVWDVEDLNDLVKAGWNSSLGDANLDGRFNSSDLVQVLSAGKYDAPLDSTWSEGDWSCDRRFTTHDFVVALAHGGYDVAAVAAAPPSSPSGLRPLNRAEMAAGRAWLLESVHRSKSGKIPRRGPARLAAAPVTHAVSQRPLLPPASVEQIFADPAEVLSPPSRAIGIYTSRIRPHPAPHPACGHLLPGGE